MGEAEFWAAAHEIYPNDPRYIPVLDSLGNREFMLNAIEEDFLDTMEEDIIDTMLFIDEDIYDEVLSEDTESDLPSMG